MRACCPARQRPSSQYSGIGLRAGEFHSCARSRGIDLARTSNTDRVRIKRGDRDSGGSPVSTVLQLGAEEGKGSRGEGGESGERRCRIAPPAQSWGRREQGGLGAAASAAEVDDRARRGGALPLRHTPATTESLQTFSLLFTAQ